MVQPITLSAEVKEALSASKPLVALESTIITHGMPYPANVETALAVEQVVRDQGAVPATIGILKGMVKVGLDKEELQQLANDQQVLKLSTRDLPYALMHRRSGGTTVAATVKIAELAGIRVFATGGIGGVHREGNETFDVSADLQQLAHSTVMVVCAGAKSILDLNLTLEKLETLGVPVIGYQTDVLPAFYYRDSGLSVTHRLDTPDEVAQYFRLSQELDGSGTPLITVPIPEEAACSKAVIERAIEKALRLAHEEGIHGKAVTPFLLQAMVEATEGKSLEANIALIKNNAKVASQVSCALMLE